MLVGGLVGAHRDLLEDLFLCDVLFCRFLVLLLKMLFSLECCCNLLLNPFWLLLAPGGGRSCCSTTVDCKLHLHHPPNDIFLVRNMGSEGSLLELCKIQIHTSYGVLGWS